ncbi:MAG: glycosyltransferase family 4 protein, partial [Anaerolineae bacterium]
CVMRIVMIGPFGLRPRGTMSVRALPLARALAARGHAVTLLLPPWQNPQDAGRCWEEAGVRVENIPLPPRVSLLFHWQTARRLAARALALRPDVVHFFKPKAYSGLAHFLLALRPRARRPRLVVDSDDWEGPGGWNDMTDPASGRPLYTPAQRRFFTGQERWGLTHADAVTVASRTLESLVWALGVPPRRVFYVPNGWSGAEVPPAPRAHEGSPVILLYTRFFEFPVSRVVGLLRRVRERVTQARLLVVGEGLFGEETRLLEEARQAGLAEAVEYVGWAEPEELPNIFARATLAIYPFDDTLINRAKCPVKLLDLLGAGVPVVAEEVGEIREAIRHGETGWLVPSGDEVAFAEGVLRLLEAPALRRRLGLQAAQEIRQRRSWAHLATVVERAYRG